MRVEPRAVLAALTLLAFGCTASDDYVVGSHESEPEADVLALLPSGGLPLDVPPHLTVSAGSDYLALEAFTWADWPTAASFDSNLPSNDSRISWRSLAITAGQNVTLDVGSRQKPAWLSISAYSTEQLTEHSIPEEDALLFMVSECSDQCRFPYTFLSPACDTAADDGRNRCLTVIFANWAPVVRASEISEAAYPTASWAYVQSGSPRSPQPTGR